ncbi:DUF3429 domain-containing protein (plasmid) [Pseudoalteromonas sp. T1lg65]|uniref:DUF3429 domain-containing protein n=1 Tax=Pseudoalteromonas sp. T1lg65 TaxID=2077101 RepID=UPI003F79C7DF
MHPYFNHIQLGYFGLLPFLACIAWILMTGASIEVINAFQYYALGILAFMAGSLWRAGEQSYKDAILAVLVVIPYPLMGFMPQPWILGYLAIAFWVVLLFERKMPVWQDYHKDYRKMRTVLTSIVFVTHLFMIAQYFSISAITAS